MVNKSLKNNVKFFNLTFGVFRSVSRAILFQIKKFYKEKYFLLLLKVLFPKIIQNFFTESFVIQNML